MLNSRQDLDDRQAELVARAADERQRLTLGMKRLHPYVDMVGGVARMGKVLRAYWGWLAIGLAAAAIRRPRTVLRLGGRLWAGWRALRTVRRLLAAILGRSD